MLCIFLGDIGMLCRDLPINTEAVVEDADTSISLWMIEVTLILEHSYL